MKAAVFRRPGAALDVVEVVEQEAPSAPRARNLLVRVARAPMHPGDLLLLGAPSDSGFAPRALGTEGMGVVLSAGDGVSGFTAGDRVAFFPSSGSWREVIQVPADTAVLVPDEVSDAVASLMLVNTVTARDILRAVDDAGGGRAGVDGPLLVTAAASSVGKIVIAEALARGLSVLPIVRSESSAKVVAEHFPELTAITTSDAAWQEALRSAIAGRPVPVIVDAHGGPFTRAVLPFLSDAGTLLVYGDLSRTATGMETFDVLVREYRIRGVSISRWGTRPDDVRQADVRAAVDLAARSPQLFEVAGVFPLDDVTDAIAAAQKPGKRGTPVLSMS